MGYGYYGNWFAEMAAAMLMMLAKAATAATVLSIKDLIASLGAKTEPDFQAIVPAYDRMLAVALLLLGGVVAFALMERLLGGRSGGGWNLIGRVVASVAIAFLGLPLVQLAANYAALLANVWDWDYAYRAMDLFHRVEGLYTGHVSQGGELGLAMELLVTGLISLLLALVVHIELVLRAALILVTSTFIPLVAILAIWPRFQGTITHLFEFLFGVLAAKFLMATAIYVGYAVLVSGIPANAAPEPSVMVTGIAVLAVAAFGPLLLFQGIRIGHHAAAPVARSWTAGAAGLTAGPLRSLGRVGRQGLTSVGRRVASRRTRARSGSNSA